MLSSLLQCSSFLLFYSPICRGGDEAEADAQQAGEQAGGWLSADGECAHYGRVQVEVNRGLGRVLVATTREEKETRRQENTAKI